MHKFIRLFPVVAGMAVLAMLNAGCTAKVKENYHQRRADRYFDAGQYDQAEIEYRNVLRIDHQNARAWSRLGLIFFGQGRFLAASPVLLRAQQLATNDFEVRADLGTIYLAAGRRKDAQDEASFILAGDPRNRQAPILLAQTAVTADEIRETRARLQKLSAAGDPVAFAVALGTLSLRENDLKDAGADFKRAQSLDPKSSEAAWALGDLYLAEKDVKQADQAYKTAADLAPPRTGKKLQYAQFKIAIGSPADGKRLMEELLNAAPDYLPALVGLAQLAAAEKRFDDATALLAKVLSRDPDNYEAVVLDSRVKLAQGATAQAIDELERVAKRYPQVPQFFYQLAVAYLANNDTDKAMADLNQALKLNPQYAEAAVLLAQIQIKNGNAAAGITALKQIIRQQPQLVEAKLLLADAYRLQDNLDDAVQIYQELKIAQPNNPQIHLLLGSTLLEQKLGVQARAEFEKAFALAPDYLPALEQLVNLDLAEKQFTAAQQRVEQQVQANPKSAALQLLLAKVSAARGDTTQEEAQLSKAIELQPDSPIAYLLLAQLYTDSGRDKNALEQLQTALAKNPRNVSLLMFEGMIYNAEKKYPEAAEAYKKALAIDPKSVLALNNLACLDSEQLGQLDAAEPLARQAVALQPADPVIADTLGWVLYKKKQYSSALVFLQQSAGKLPDEPEAQFHLGMARYATGGEAEARAAFQRALQPNKDFPDRDECRQCLAVLAVDVKTAGADARTSLEKRVAGHPDDLIALLRLAAIYQRDGETKKAVATYGSALKTDPQNVTAMLNLANLYAAGDVPRAFELAKSAYKLAPNDPNASLVLGRLAHQTGDDNWAYTLLFPAFQNNSAGPDTLYDFGLAAYNVGKNSDAATAMQNALQTAPAFSHAADAKRFLDLLVLAGNPTAAAANEPRIAEILKSEPDYVPALMVEGIINEQKSNPDAAAQLYENILGRHPDFAPAQRRLAILYSGNPGKDQRTYDLATKARQAFPDDPDIARALGIVVYRMASASGDYPRAAGLLAESARSRPHDAELFYYLGMAQFHSKQQADSKANLQRALALNLSGKLADDAKKTLAGMK